MASSNIKLFDENKGNMLSDTEFNISNQRMNGLQTGVASSQLQNKAMYQASLIAYAIAQVMTQNGKNANDTDAVSAFVANLSGTMLQKVYDIATTAEAQAGVATGKWMSPALVKAAIDTLAAKAQNILSDETKTLLGGNASMVPNDAFVALKNLIDGISPDKIGATRVVTGSFAGTGSTSSKTITAGFKPKAAIFAANNYGIFASGGQAAANVSGIAIWIEGITKINTGGYSYDDIYDTVNVTQTETGLILQNDETYNLPNKSGVTYYYAIFGQGGSLRENH